MQDIPLDTKNRAPSSQVLQEVIRRAPAEYVTQSSTQFRPPAPNVTGSLKLTAGGYFFHLGHNRSFSARNAGRPAVREHLEDSTPIHVRGRTLSGLEARDGRAWGGSYTTRLQHGIDFSPIRSVDETHNAFAMDQIAGCEQAIVFRSKGARDSIPVQPRIKIMRGPTHVGARVSFHLEIYRRLLVAIAIDLILNDLSFAE